MIYILSPIATPSPSKLCTVDITEVLYILSDVTKIQFIYSRFTVPMTMPYFLRFPIFVSASSSRDRSPTTETNYFLETCIIIQCGSFCYLFYDQLKDVHQLYNWSRNTKFILIIIIFHYSSQGPGWLNELGSLITSQLIQAYHQYGVDSRPAL